MTIGILLTSALFLLLGPFQDGPPSYTTPLRNTFISATETVIDDAGAIDIHADDTHFNAAMQQLKQVQSNLVNMASEDREQSIAEATRDLIFVINSCHIQAKDGASTDKCQARITTSQNRIMESINRHKQGNSWVDGKPF